MKVLGVETADMTIFGKFTFTNTTDFPIVVSLWQTSPLYYRVLQPEQTWSTGSIGAFWFTVKVWLYNGKNNINPSIKYGLLAGNIVGFAALGAVGLTATALGATYGASRSNPDWEEWLVHNNLKNTLSIEEQRKGMASIKHCEYSEAGYYAGKHPHLYVCGGPVVQYQKTDDGTATMLLWHEMRVGKTAVENDSIVTIRPKLAPMTAQPDPSFHAIAQNEGREKQLIRHDGAYSDDSEDEDAPMLSGGRGR